MRLQGVFTFCLLGLIFAHGAQAGEPTSVAALAQSPKWLKLLHYAGNGPKYESDAVSPGFFLTPQGRTHPEAELRAMRAELQRSPEIPRDDESPICKFPARALWTARQFNLPRPRAQCAAFAQFRASLSAQAVSVVFSSYYLNNPSSAFGHTFLRLRRSRDPKDTTKSDLLDYGINYAAIQTSSNAVIYALSGAMGWFKGSFTKLPFYYKVREYSDFESRDLWFYNLDLSPEQVEELVRHIWELGQTEFDYYFFSANCSYQILAALEAVEPDWRLLERLGHLVLPAQTIRLLWDTPHLVDSITYRASARKRFEAQVHRLSSQETSVFKELITQKTPEFSGAALSPTERQDILDAVIDYYDFEHPKELVFGDSQASREKQKFLIARAELGSATADPIFATPTDKEPHLGHGSSRASLQGGYGTALKSYSELGYRGSFHDLLDQPDGYPDFAEVQILDLGVRAYYESFKLQLEKAALVENSSLTPIHEFSHPFSWRFNLGANRLDEKACPNCLAGQVLLAAGYTVELWPSVFYSYLLINAEETWATSFPNSKLRLGVGPTLGIRLQLSRELTALSETAGWYYVASRPDRLATTRLNLRYALSGSYAVGASYAYTNYESDLGLTYFVYF